MGESWADSLSALPPYASSSTTRWWCRRCPANHEEAVGRPHLVLVHVWPRDVVQKQTRDLLQHVATRLVQPSRTGLDKLVNALEPRNGVTGVANAITHESVPAEIDEHLMRGELRGAPILVTRGPSFPIRTPGQTGIDDRAVDRVIEPVPALQELGAAARTVSCPRASGRSTIRPLSAKAVSP